MKQMKMEAWFGAPDILMLGSSVLTLVPFTGCKGRMSIGEMRIYTLFQTSV